MKRKFTAVLLALALVLCMSLSVSAAMEKDARDGVVVVTPLFHTDAGVSESYGWGSGFFINDQYLITNYHVVSEYIVRGSGTDVELSVEGTKVRGYAELRVYYDSSYFVQAALVGVDEARDLALLKLADPTTERTPLALKIPTDDMVGTSIYAVGFPGLADNWYSRATETWGRSNATVTSGTISRLFVQGGSGQQNIQTDCEIKPGNSGGPVVDEAGNVIGIATWLVETGDAERIYYAVNVTHVIDLLNQYGVKYTSASTPTTPTEDTATEPTEKPSWLEENWPVAAGAAVAVLVVVVLVIVLVSKKKPAAPVVQAAPVAPAAPAHMPTATVRSFAQCNYGASAAVAGQPVIIGRGSVCALRFPSNAPGISGSHCSVQWDSASQTFIVTDLNSTYGTYLMTGQRLQPNQPCRLRAGERIYLGEQANVVSLNLE